MGNKIKMCIAGNPNCGKTTVFNLLTGARQSVGNWPGVTVERIMGIYSYKEQNYEMVDLPGIYSLSASSLDEKIAKEYIVDQKPDLVVNIVDASNLERNLYLTIQLIELGLPILLVLNMIDKADRKETKINVDKLSQMLDCPVVGVSANTKGAEKELKEAVLSASKERKISQVLNNEKAKAEHAESVKQAEKTIEDDLDVFMADKRYRFIKKACNESVDKPKIAKTSVTDIVDKFVLNRFLGVPLFFVAMYLTFWITINLGSCFIDFFDILFGAVFVEGLGKLLASIHMPAVVIAFLANGLGAGIQTIATFIPPIFLMFFCLTILEDSGYMARAAVVMDRLMRSIGLPGKAFVPMLIGFGCNVPAILATRTLEQKKDRIITAIINPFMSCGARMPVYALFTAAFFPRSGGLVVFSLYAVGVGAAILTALLLKNTKFKDTSSFFIMELPNYHKPIWRNIFLHAWMRLKAFIFKAGQAILAAIVILGVLNSFTVEGKVAKQNSTESVLSYVGKKTVPVFKPMGITDENWPAAVGLFTGIFAKEAVIGTLDSLYSQMDAHMESKDDSDVFSFKEKIKEAGLSVKNNISKIDLPFTFKRETNGQDFEVIDKGMKKSILKRFDGKVGAYAYMLFVLLYVPCVAAVAAIYKELGFKWAVFSCVYQTFIAWTVATIFYQVAKLII